MPMIELTLPAGVLTDSTRRELQKTLIATLLKWEGAPDTAFVRAVAWSRIDEVPGDRFVALEDDLPRMRVDVTVPVGALSARRKEGLVKELTEQILTAAGLPASEALRVWVLIHEQPDGTWAAGGNIMRFEDIKSAAEATRTQE